MKTLEEQIKILANKVISSVPVSMDEEPISGGNLPSTCDSRTCRSVYVENIHAQVTELLLQQIFSAAGPLEGCKLIRKGNSSYGFVDYSYQSSAAFAILTLNGRHLWAQPLKVDWAYISVADLSPKSEVNDPFEEMPEPISIGEVRSQEAVELSEASDIEDAKETKICVEGEESKEEFSGDFSRSLMGGRMLSSFRSSLAEQSFTSATLERHHTVNEVMLLNISGLILKSLISDYLNLTCLIHGECLVPNVSVAKVVWFLFDPGGSSYFSRTKSLEKYFLPYFTRIGQH